LESVFARVKTELRVQAERAVVIGPSEKLVFPIETQPARTSKLRTVTRRGSVSLVLIQFPAINYMKAVGTSGT
jgi:hypothetical protein